MGEFRKSKISSEDFVIAYMEAHKAGKSQKQLADELETTSHAISARKGRLKYNAGIILPALRGGGWSKIPKDKLNRIIQDYEMGRR